MLFTQAFKGLNDWYRYLFGIALVIVAYFIGQMPLTAVLFYRMSSDSSIGMEALSAFEQGMDFEMFGINKNVGFSLLILMFAIALAGLYFVVKYLHDKKMKALITPHSKVDYNKIFYGFGFWLLITILMEAINYAITPENYVFRWNGGDFIILVLISLLFLPIQTSFEELFFRGYIMQGIAFFARNKWLPILLSSVLFGLMHGTNPEVAQYGFWTMQFYYIIAGIFLAVITVLDDGLELALGVHAATNIAGATLFTYKGSVLQTDSLFMTQEIKPWVMILSFIIASVVFIWFFGRKYQWPTFSTLMDGVVPADEQILTNAGEDHALDTNA